MDFVFALSPTTSPECQNVGQKTARTFPPVSKSSSIGIEANYSYFECRSVWEEVLKTKKKQAEQPPQLTFFKESL
jgi:hypothetical protein